MNKNFKYTIAIAIIVSSFMGLSFLNDFEACHHKTALASISDPIYDQFEFDSIFAFNSSFMSQGFDFPVGKPNAVNYYKACNFGQRNHLGEDWNGVGGGNTDLGDPVYSLSNGIVTFAENVCCGWGNVVRVVHKISDSQQYEYIESVYAHLHQFNVSPGQMIRRGDRIGSIGTANGEYSAHLHLEVRDFINMNLGPGYSEDQFGFLDPTLFIQAHRP